MQQLAQAPAQRRQTASRVDALYIHVPFCFHKCHYCDFFSVVDGDDERQRRFTDALLSELGEWVPAAGPRDRPRLQPRTIFVGGGTPTLLALDQWQRLADALAAGGVLERVEEFTVEANPETVTAALAQRLVSFGVNRVSIGAQSFEPQMLEALQRKHDPANVARAVATFRNAGIGQINVDLIFATPGQTVAMLETDLASTLALEVDHVSCYCLTYEPGTPLERRRRLGLVRPTEEHVERDMFERVCDRLENAGFEHYEISNWARIDDGPRSHRCQHNLVYWRNGNWLGLGPSAASHCDGRRWKNEARLEGYLESDGRPKTVDDETLPAPRRIGEMLMLGLRLREGIDQSWLASQLPRSDPRWTQLDELCEMQLLERKAGRLRLTRGGLFVADRIFERLL